MALVPTLRDLLRTGPSGGVALPSTIAQPPKPPRNLMPPTVQPHKPAPAQSPLSNRNASAPVTNKPQANSGGSGLPTTGAAARQPFNLFGMPKTQGDFNRLVNSEASPLYQPQLDQNSADVSAENAANKLRNSDISSIYSQYNDQSTQAFNDTQKAIKDIIAMENAGTGAAGQYLSAALNAGNTGQNQLAQMMGTPGAPSSETAPYLATAANENAIGQNYEGALASSDLARAGQAVTNAGTERASQLNTESTRHGAEIQTLGSNRDAIVATIPDIIEKTRQQLITDLTNQQGVKFQEGLASKQFGLSKAAQDANINNANRTLAMNEANSRENRAATQQQIRDNQFQLHLNQEAVNAKVVADKAKLDAALGKAQGQRQANAIKYLEGWSTPGKQDYITKRVTNPVTGTSTTEKVLDTTKWHLDPGNTLKALMIDYGLSQNEALALMSSLAVPIGGSQGTESVGQWAQTFNQRSAQNVANGVTNRLSPYPEGTHGAGNAVSGAAAPYGTGVLDSKLRVRL